MECLLYVWVDRAKPWAVFCPQTNELVFSESVQIHVECDTIASCRDYLSIEFGIDKSNYPDERVPNSVVRAFGRFKVKEGVILILPDITLF